MLTARTNSSYFTFEEHFRMNLVWLETIVLLTRAQNVVVAHAPAIQIVCGLIKRVAVVRAGEDLRITAFR